MLGATYDIIIYLFRINVKAEQERYKKSFIHIAKISEIVYNISVYIISENSSERVGRV